MIIDIMPQSTYVGIADVADVVVVVVVDAVVVGRRWEEVLVALRGK